MSEFLQVAPPPTQQSTLPITTALFHFLPWATLVYQRLLGRLPNTTRWHPYTTILRHAKAAIASVAMRGPISILLVSSADTIGSLLVRDVDGEKLAITVAMLKTGLYTSLLRGRTFDLCICDLAFDDLSAFRRMLGAIRPHMRRGGKVVVFHQNETHRRLNDWITTFARGLFPIIGKSKISFSGCFAGAIASRRFNALLRKHNVHRPLGFIVAVGTLALCMPLARFAVWQEQRRRPEDLPRYCTSMTLDLDLP